MTLRREFDLLPDDKACLDEHGVPWETIIDHRSESGSMWILIHDFSIKHCGYNRKTVTAAILMPSSYPYTKLDMAYFFPPLAREDGEPINSTEHRETIDGKRFQRWSRHHDSWNSEEDNLETHLMMIEDFLEMELEK